MLLLLEQSSKTSSVILRPFYECFIRNISHSHEKNCKQTKDALYHPSLILLYKWET